MHSPSVSPATSSTVSDLIGQYRHARSALRQLANRPAAGQARERALTRHRSAQHRAELALAAAGHRELAGFLAEEAYLRDLQAATAPAHSERHAVRLVVLGIDIGRYRRLIGDRAVPVL